jgi:hypothetical protein
MPYDVTIKRPTPCGMLMLKGDRIAQDRLSEVLGMDIPRISNTATVHDTYSVLWQYLICEECPSLKLQKGDPGQYDHLSALTCHKVLVF